MILVSQTKRVLLALLLASPAFAQPGANPDGKSPKSGPEVRSGGDTAEQSDTAEQGEPAQAPPRPRDASPPAANPHGMAMGAPPTNRSFVDEQLPEGTVVVEVVDGAGNPLKGAKVRLLTHFQSIAEGNDEDVTEKPTDESGEARFDGLDTAIRFSYGVAVEHDGANYDAPGFRLGKTGQRVVVHTFPVSEDPREAFVGIQAFITVRVNDDLLRVDGGYRVINMSRTTWKPKPIFLKLPDDAQGVEAKLTMGDAGFEEAPGGMNLVGSFPPGQKDLAFAFHVPNTNEETRTIQLAVPPHAVDVNVLIEQAPGMGLSVSPGFEPAETRVGRDDKKVLVTRRVMRPGEGSLSSIVIELSGLPVIGPGRWIAALIALGVALLGLFAALLKQKETDEEKGEQRDRARNTLLDEMKLLERAHRDGEIGPRTYEQTKREIMVALARLEPN